MENQFGNYILYCETKEVKYLLGKLHNLDLQSLPLLLEKSEVNTSGQS